MMVRLVAVFDVPTITGEGDQHHSAGPEDSGDCVQSIQGARVLQ